MDPNETHKQIMLLVKEVLADPDAHLGDSMNTLLTLCEHIEALDTRIRKGGFLPQVWRREP